jgi:hypothetical protein
LNPGAVEGNFVRSVGGVDVVEVQNQVVGDGGGVDGEFLCAVDERIAQTRAEPSPRMNIEDSE